MERLFYINLPQREDRNAHMLAELKNADLDNSKITKICAVDGNSLPKEMVQQLAAKADFLETSFVNQAVGCFMTHVLIWQLIVERKINCAVILEDDVKLISGFADKVDKLISHLPTNTEIITIGLPQFENVLSLEHQTTDVFDKIFVRIVNSHVRILHPDLNPGTFAYIITLTGAENLLAYVDTFGITSAIDTFISSYLESRNIRYASKETLATTVSSLGSDISGVLPIITKPDQK